MNFITLKNTLVFCCTVLLHICELEREKEGGRGKEGGREGGREGRKRERDIRGCA